MLMMLALCWIKLDWVELLCVQTPEDERVSSKTEFQLMLMMLALRFAEFVQ